MADLTTLHKNAHPNSIFARKFPNGCTTADLPNWDADRSDVDAEYSPQRHLDGRFPDRERELGLVAAWELWNEARSEDVAHWSTTDSEAIAA